MKGIGYIRVSTEEQRREGYSLAAQEEVIRRYFSFKQIELVELYVDAGVSAFTPLHKRPAGASTLASLDRKEADLICAIKLDRLFRNAVDCLNVTTKWERRGVAMHLVDLGGQAIDTSTAMGKFMLTVMAAAAELERNHTSDRTRLIMQHLKKRGRRVGSVPFGFRSEMRGEGDEEKSYLVEDEKERKTVTAIVDMHNADRSLRSITSELNAGPFQPRGRRWYVTTVQRILEAA